MEKIFTMKNINEEDKEDKEKINKEQRRRRRIHTIIYPVDISHSLVITHRHNIKQITVFWFFFPAVIIIIIFSQGVI